MCFILNTSTILWAALMDTSEVPPMSCEIYLERNLGFFPSALEFLRLRFAGEK